MTSATGEPRGKAGRRSKGGFTMVEIIVVMAIIVTLFSLVAVGLRSVMGTASEKATNALLRRLLQNLDEYHSEMGNYPPDGIDSPEKNQNEIIRGSACLYYYLTKPLLVPEKVGGEIKLRQHEPIAKFSDKELSPEDSEHPGVRELVDGWGTPLHYDNTEDEEFKPQGGEVHFPEVDEEEHPNDPRDGTVVVDGKAAVPKAGIQKKGYDLWSHGRQGHSKKGSSLPIASWNLKD